MHSKTWVLKSLAVMVAAAGCGGSSSSSSSTPTTPGFYIVISGFAYAPLNLRAPAGATVTVLNRDSMAHSVTSEATAGAFTPGAVAGVSFDTGPFTGNMSFPLPSDAPEHTVIPYYCSVHKGTMATPNGSITIDNSAQPGPPPGGGPPGGY